MADIGNIIKVVSAYGTHIAELRRAPVFGKLGADYGLPRAVTLYLRFQLGAAGLFSLIFLLSIPHVIGERCPFYPPLAMRSPLYPPLAMRDAPCYPPLAMRCPLYPPLAVRRPLYPP